MTEIQHTHLFTLLRSGFQAGSLGSGSGLPNCPPLRMVISPPAESLLSSTHTHPDLGMKHPNSLIHWIGQDSIQETEDNLDLLSSERLNTSHQVGESRRVRGSHQSPHNHKASDQTDSGPWMQPLPILMPSRVVLCTHKLKEESVLLFFAFQSCVTAFNYQNLQCTLVSSSKGDEELVFTLPGPVIQGHGET